MKVVDSPILELDRRFVAAFVAVEIRLSGPLESLRPLNEGKFIQK